MKANTKNVLISSLAALALALPLAAQSQDKKVITIVVPFAAGGPIDTGARLIATHLATKLGQPVVVDNKPGGSALIAARAVTNAPADGNTLFMQSVSTLSPVFIKDLQFDVLKEMEPVVPVWSYSNYLFVNTKGDLKTFVADAKRAPGKMNYGYATASGLLMMEMFKNASGIDVTAIPYKGSAPTSLAMLSGEVQATMDPLGQYKQHVDTGKVRPILFTGSARSAVFPDVPTAREAGFPKLDISITGGFWTRAGAPQDTVRRIATATTEILGQPEVREKFATFGWSVNQGTAADLLKSTRAERTFWENAARIAKYTPE